MAPGGAPSSGCLLWDCEHSEHSRTARLSFLHFTTAPWRSAPGALRALHYGLQRPPAARHLSGEARRSRNRGPAASLARRGSPGPLREQRTHHEHATRLGETVCSRCAARLVQYRTPVNLIVNIIKGSHRRERAVAFTSYCKPEKHLKDRFAAQKPTVLFLTSYSADSETSARNWYPLPHHLLL